MTRNRELAAATSKCEKIRSLSLSLRRRITSIPAWLWFSVLTIILWGLWGIQSKFIVDRIPPLANQVLFTPGLLVVAALFGMRGDPSSKQPRNRKLGAFFALLTGILGGTGNIAFFEALKGGPQVSVVVPVTALYPMVTVLLALVLLRERLNPFQWIGLGMAIAAIVILGG